LKPGKNDFVEISKNLGRYKIVHLKIVLLNCQNYYVGCSSIIGSVKNFDIPAIA